MNIRLWPVSIPILVILAGCASNPTSARTSAPEGGMLIRYVAGVLIDRAGYTRTNRREVAGWCWSNKQTGNLAYLAQAQVGTDKGVALTLPSPRTGMIYISCSWHTHPWGRHVAPGPSAQDLDSSMRASVRGITHFVVDQHGIWQYRQGRVTEMCPWNGNETNIDAARCHS